jgi:hypothetical protein
VAIDGGILGLGSFGKNFLEFLRGFSPEFHWIFECPKIQELTQP